jgi:hypothetical protein
MAAVSNGTVCGAVDRGNPRAAEALLPLVYEELRRFAASTLAGQPPGQTLQPTALVHEVSAIGVSPLNADFGVRHGHALSRGDPS